MYSMTGYGRCDLEKDGREITLELKSVNHRYLDLSFRMPRTFSYLEDSLRSLLQKELSRGHVDIFVSYKNRRKDAKSVSVDAGLVKGYMDALQEVSKLSGLPMDVNLSFVSRMPDVLSVDEEAEDLDALKALALQACESAISALKQMRASEGLRMGEDISARLDTVREVTLQVKERAPQIAQEYRVKLQQRLDELLAEAPLDEGRITQEVAIYSDRIAVDEEIARLLSHLSAMQEAMEKDESIGRRLDFIVQEMNREVNTIGSKASDAQLIAHVVNLKSEIEKIREQVQNIE